MALKRIQLRDFVIVRELELDLHAGFSVLTGETGAGKSILIDALQLVLGSRADAGVVREGAARTEISAEFDSPKTLSPWLEDAGFAAEDSLLLRRNIDAQGKSRAWINGSAATATQLREVADHLVDIHGQHAWAGLMRADEVRRLLDAYGLIDASPVAQAHTRWREAAKALSDAQAAQTSIETERERLQWQITELAKLAPGDQEWSELNAEHGLLSNAQGLIDAAQEALERLEGKDHGDGVIPQISKTHALLLDHEQSNKDWCAQTEVLSSILAQAEDVAHELHSFLRKTSPDPTRLAQLDERLSLWMSLAKRFRRTPEDLPALLQGWQSDLAKLDAASDLDALTKAEAQSRDALNKACKSLSAARKKAAPQLAAAITQAMQGLGMQGGQFDVQLSALPEPTAHGSESVEFLVAGHAGSTPRPVGKVASGGELSRIALAIAVTTSQLGSAGTLIFDEVDSGVGGAVAETVGRLMKQLGKDRQVLAVTHLPQVASCADHHLLVAKHVSGKQTVSDVQSITGETRVAEIARMLGGEKLSGTSLAHAKEMLGL
jgi:DNA repair protein RecN (Recombination protein N)